MTPAASVTDSAKASKFVVPVCSGADRNWKQSLKAGYHIWVQALKASAGCPSVQAQVQAVGPQPAPPHQVVLGGAGGGEEAVDARQDAGAQRLTPPLKQQRLKAVITLQVQALKARAG